MRRPNMVVLFTGGAARISKTVSSNHNCSPVLVENNISVTRFYSPSDSKACSGLVGTPLWCRVMLSGEGTQPLGVPQSCSPLLAVAQPHPLHAALMVSPANQCSDRTLQTLIFLLLASLWIVIYMYFSTNVTLRIAYRGNFPKDGGGAIFKVKDCFKEDFITPSLKST